MWGWGVGEEFVEQEHGGHPTALHGVLARPAPEAGLGLVQPTQAGGQQHTQTAVSSTCRCSCTHLKLKPLHSKHSINNKPRTDQVGAIFKA